MRCDEISKILCNQDPNADIAVQHGLSNGETDWNEIDKNFKTEKSRQEDMICSNNRGQSIYKQFAHRESYTADATIIWFGQCACDKMRLNQAPTKQSKVNSPLSCWLTNEALIKRN